MDLPLIRSIGTPGLGDPPRGKIALLRPAPSHTASCVSQPLKEREDLVARISAQLHPRTVEQPKYRSFALRISLEAIDHRTHPLVNDLGLWCP